MTDAGMARAITLAAQIMPHGLAHWATVCSTWVVALIARVAYARHLPLHCYAAVNGCVYCYAADGKR